MCMELQQPSLPSITCKAKYTTTFVLKKSRRVSLLKGQWADKICFRLHHATLANQPSYKASSYVWGSPKATRPAFVNGWQHSVTVNLESALRRLRKVNRDLNFSIERSVSTSRTIMKGPSRYVRSRYYHVSPNHFDLLSPYSQCTQSPSGNLHILSDQLSLSIFPDKWWADHVLTAFKTVQWSKRERSRAKHLSSPITLSTNLWPSKLRS